MPTGQRFLVIGAGGMGAYYGARLQAAGHDVTYLARGEQLNALRRDGLTVHHPEFAFRDAVDALSTDEFLTRSAAPPYTLALLTTKAGATREIVGRLARWLRAEPETSVLSLQNGVDSEREIAEVVGLERTIGGLAVRIGGHVVQPGVVEARGPGEVILGAWPTAHDNPDPRADLPALVRTFTEAGAPTTLSDDIRRELWKKLMINNAMNPLSVLTGLDTHTLSNHPTLGRSVYRIMEETARAAAADGVEIGTEDIDKMFELIRNFEPIKTSMLVDYEKGRSLEIDEIAGVVVERSRSVGRDAPLTALVMGLLAVRLEREDGRH